jgi:hypothetical protein
MKTVERPRVRPFPADAYLTASEARVAARRWMAMRRSLWRATLRPRANRRGCERLRRPAWALRTAIAEYRACGPALTAEGISPFRQLSRTWWNVLRYRAPVAVVRHYALLPSTSRRAARLCLIAGANMPLVYKLARAASDERAADTLADKRRFATWCGAHALPSIATVAEFEAGRLVGSLHDGEGLPRESLFSKWSEGFGGEDTATWHYDDGSYRGGDGRQWSAAELVARLAEQSLSGPVLLQPRLVNHTTIARLSPRALSTIRVMTTAVTGRAPAFLVGVLRMGTGDATADNFAQGGIAAPVDAETGELGDARGLDVNDLPCGHRHHPDTGEPIAGTRLPFWRESIDLALRAHALLGDLPVVGWDIAITPNGPVLVEGNWNPCIKLLQVATQTPVLTTTLATAVLARVGEPLRTRDRSWVRSAVG